MQKIKNWKSYQQNTSKKKKKSRSIFSLIKIFVAIFLIAAVAYGAIRFYRYEVPYFFKKTVELQGTGIRPINFSDKKKIDGDGVSLGVNGGKITGNAKFSLKYLKRYFKKDPPKFDKIRGSHYVQKIDGYTIVYTVDPVVQKEAESVFKNYSVPFAAVAAVNPETGAVLALASYSSNKSKTDEISPLLAYPPGSLVKIITASAAIESKGFYPGLNICFNGGLYGTDEEYWKQNISIGANSLPFSIAFAKSCDVAFGKIAGYYVGKKLLYKYFNKFYFNNKIPFILNLHKSRAKIPNGFYQLELTGAGFKNVRATPLQEAMIAGAPINGGRLVKPYIIKEIISKKGKIIYMHKGIKTIDNPITLKTAKILKQMMIDTNTKGIGRPDFFNYYGQYMLPGVISGGKTGTISGKNPTGLYQWFAGFGESGGRKIALSAVVVEKPVWRITGGGVAEKMMFAYFFKK